MAKLFLLRHLKSQWNLENRFTGWVDIPLMKSIDFNSSLKRIIENNEIDRIYTSVLFRNMRTVEKLFEDTDRYPVFVHIDKGRMKEWGFFEKEGGK